jgi:hypothetical protein
MLEHALRLRTRLVGRQLAEAQHAPPKEKKISLITRNIDHGRPKYECVAPTLIKCW